MIDKKLSHSVKYLDEDELDKIETNEIKTYSLYHNNHV